MRNRPLQIPFGRRAPGPSPIGPRVIGAALLGLAGLGFAAPVAAQSGDAVSRPVVQPLPPAGVSDLTSALQRLARDSRDVDALIDAGNASLALDDIDAAIGFFGRAQELSPQNPRIKLGLAGAFVRSERPLEALRLFEEAERAGVSTRAFASERGLAYDLVGDSAAAQAQYRLALASGADDETTRRLAISQAIAGDREGFEETLYPLLESQDFASFRARAFGLAILGEEDEAVAIAEAVMPRDLSARIAPYLQYMGRLTRAQQAAAANLGMFPRAAQIGRDDPRIAQYAARRGSPAAAPDARLAPQGEPLGPRAQRRAEERREAATTRESRRAARNRSRAAAAAPTEPPADGPAPGRVAATSQASPGAGPEPAELPPAAQAQAPVPVVSQPVVQQIAASTDDGGEGGARGAAVDTAPPAMPDAAPAALAAASGTPAAPGFDLAAVPGAVAAGAERGGAEQGAATGSPTARPASGATPGPAARVEDAFADFRLLPRANAPQSPDVVDIRTIEPPREVEEKPAAEPAPPAHPRRFWVQVATGRDLEAFRFDWRRISRKAPEILGEFKPMTAPWGQANRLLAGPFPSAKAAADAVTALREAGLDSFPFTSAQGEEISPL